MRTEIARRLRIAFLAQENLAVPPPVPGSSVSRVVHELARGLAVEHDVAVCSLPHRTVPEGKHDGILFLRVPSGLDERRHGAARERIRVARRLDLPHRELQGLGCYARGYARRGLQRLAATGPDVIQLQNVSQFLPLARRIAPESRLVLHMHCDWLLQLPEREVRRRLEHASLVLGVSDYIADGIRNRFPELGERCRTLYNGVDTTLFRSREELPGPVRERVEELRSRHRIAGPVVLYVGSIAPEKGTDVLLRAFRLVLQEIPEATLVIIGRLNRYFQVRAPRGRRARAELRRRERAYPEIVDGLSAPLGPRLVEAGGIEHGELPAWYALADVFTMPSVGNEPFALPVLEALAAGLPVVATRRGGLPEAVADGVNGLLIPPNDPEALAAALAGLCLDRENARTMGAAGRARALQEFAWQAQADRLAGYYLDITSRSPCSTGSSFVARPGSR